MRIKIPPSFRGAYSFRHRRKRRCHLPLGGRLRVVALRISVFSVGRGLAPAALKRFHASFGKRTAEDVGPYKVRTVPKTRRGGACSSRFEPLSGFVRIPFVGTDVLGGPLMRFQKPFG